MGFTEALTTSIPTPKGPPCSLGLLLDELDDAQAAEVVDALGSPLIGHSVISRAIQTEFGKRIAPGIVGRHRRGQCLCEVRRGVH